MRSTFPFAVVRHVADVVGDGAAGRKARVGAGVAHADVELPVGADGQPAAVVVRGAAKVLEQHQDSGLRRAALLVGAGQDVVRTERDPEHAVLVGGARAVRGVEVEEGVGLELRIHLDAEQSLLAVAVDGEAARGHHAPVGAADLHRAGLLGHHHPAVGQEAEVGQLALTGDVGRELEGVRRPSSGERLGRGRDRGQEGRATRSPAHAWLRSRASRTPAAKAGAELQNSAVPLRPGRSPWWRPRPRPGGLSTASSGPAVRRRRGGARAAAARRAPSAHIFQSAARDQSG